jgi:hypothetical protein
MNIPILVSVMILAFGWTARAEEFVPDGKATADSALREFLPTEGWSRASMRTLLGRVLADQKIDEAEREILRELQAGGVLVGFSDGTEVQVSHPEDEARRQLLLICEPTDFNSLWKTGPEGAQTMVEIATLAPITRERIVKSAANHLYAAWNKSHLTNGYDPLREEIGEVYRDMKAAGGETLTEGALILHEAMSLIDKMTRDSVPKHLYEWLAEPRNP